MATGATAAAEEPEVGGGRSDDGVTYDGSSDQGVQQPPGSPTTQWIAQQANGVPYWQDQQWNLDDEHCEYGLGGAMDWQGQAGWQMPMAMNGWQNGSRASHAGRPKRRFCTSYPDVSACRRGSSCAFAHSREEICAPLLEIEEEQQEPSALTDEFFMFKYKMRWCPIGVQHEWHTCVYAHNYQDARRPVEIGYGAKLCPYWSKKDTGAEYSQRCPLGLRCPYSHGAKEQLYHPHYFKTVVCRDLRGKACPRQRLCAFFHHRSERRGAPADDVDYTQPLASEALPENWVSEFLSPPFLPEGSQQRINGGKDGLQMYGGQMGADGQYGQMPCVFFLPMGAMVPGQGGMTGDGNTEQPEITSPTSGMSPHSAAMAAQNWVFVPMEGTGQPMPMC
eukprot:gb/GFBE01015798.1/.p1 GENE.gb/GFBE01015798.1/~~gb/GFBE01015798.1/.p1  ORF type:complete len:391 (+),score=56.35 gb/GFBE01015798.1/:1-1173(+)